MPYRFRPVTSADTPLLRAWRAQPHVRLWWGASEDEDPADVLVERDAAMWIVELDGGAFACAQDYLPHGGDPHHFADLPPGSRGIDQYIGEPDMLDRGHGSAFIRRHVERLFAAGAPVVGTDPHPNNARAIRAYRKAGFVIASDPLETRWGRALLMECRR